jgi:hypothetical protein
MTITAGGVAAFLTHPGTQLAGGVALAVAALAAAALVKTNPQAAAYAQDLADVSEEIEVWVVEAERLFPAGPDKLRHVLDRYQAWAGAQGIRGQRGRVLAKYLPGLIEAAVRRVDPRKGAS